jgi:hypothetical protein
LERLRVTDDHCGEHVNGGLGHAGDSRPFNRLARPVGVPHDADRRLRQSASRENLLRPAVLPVSPPTFGVEDRQDEVRFRRSPQPSLDHLPRRQQVAQADNGEVVT